MSKCLSPGSEVVLDGMSFCHKFYANGITSHPKRPDLFGVMSSKGFLFLFNSLKDQVLSLTNFKSTASIASFETSQSLGKYISGDSFSFECVNFSPDSRLFFIPHNERIVIYQTSSMKVLYKWAMKGPISQIKWVGNSRVMVVNSSETIHLLRCGVCQPFKSFSVKTLEEENEKAHGKTCEEEDQEGNETAKASRVDEEKEENHDYCLSFFEFDVLRGGPSVIGAAKKTWKGSFAENDQVVFRLELKETGPSIIWEHMRHERAIKAVKVSPNDHYAVSGSEDGSVVLCSAENGQVLGEYQENQVAPRNFHWLRNSRGFISVFSKKLLLIGFQRPLWDSKNKGRTHGDLKNKETREKEPVTDGHFGEKSLEVKGEIEMKDIGRWYLNGAGLESRKSGSKETWYLLVLCGFEEAIRIPLWK